MVPVSACPVSANLSALCHDARPTDVVCVCWLTVSDKIAKRMNGSLHFSSTLGKGTTATVLLPLDLTPQMTSTPKVPGTTLRNLSRELDALFTPAVAQAPVFASLAAQPEEGLRKTTSGDSENVEVDTPTQELPKEELELVPQARPPSRPVRVLAVDDNAIALRVLCTFLNSKKIEYVQAADGVEAVELFKTFRPNLVWHDWQLRKSPSPLALFSASAVAEALVCRRASRSEDVRR